MSKKEKNLSSLENISYENGDGLTDVSGHFSFLGLTIIIYYAVLHNISILYYGVFSKRSGLRIPGAVNCPRRGSYFFLAPADFQFLAGI